MSSVQSLGLHEPSALHYLVTESILPSDPPTSLYNWTVSRAPNDDGTGFVDEELITTEHCVVWSRNGVIKRALNLNVEGESILHAFVTEFGGPEEKDNVNEQEDESPKPLERGLVVVLKTQAHIFLLSGDGYVIPLCFEVESAFPFPSGFILQRKLGEDESGGHPVPPQHDLSVINETLTSIGGNSSRPSLVLPGGQYSTPKLIGSNANGMPRTFSFTEVMSELGLVVWSPNRKGETLDDCKTLPRVERLIFVSQSDELGLSRKNRQAICMALSLNETNSSFTIWHVGRDMVAPHHEKRSSDADSIKPRASLRKSSNIYGRDPGSLRESLGGSGQNYPDGALFSSLDEQKSFPANDLASQLGPEFGDVGVQTRSARRVSSMIARTNLGSGTDRNTFNDLAMGHTGRQALNRTGRRGESIGSFNDRQSFSFRRRSSFQASTSIFSAGTSFLDVSARGLLEEYDPLRQSIRLEEDTFDGSESNLPRDIGFFKVKSFPRGQGSEDSSPDVKVLTLKTPETFDRGSLRTRDIYLCIMDKSVQEMTLVKILVKFYVHGSPRKTTRPKESFELKATEIRRLSGIKDACKVVDGPIQRLLILTQSRSQIAALQLEAPWSPSFRVDLPTSYAVFDPFMGSQASTPRKDKDTGIRRVIPATEVQVQALQDSGCPAQVHVIDHESRRHTVQFRLAPRDPLVLDILKMCDMVLNMNQHESLVVAFWEVFRWLKTQKPAVNSEWVAIVVVLFSLAVPFTSDQIAQSTPSHRQKKSTLLRSSSGSAIDLTNYDAMHNEEHDMAFEAGMRGPAWDWLSQRQPLHTTTTPKSRNPRAASTSQFGDNPNDKKNSFVIKCVALAREYIQTPTGESSLGAEGYLPTSTNKEREQRCNALPSILLGLHLLYEESKLNMTSSSTMNQSKNNLVMVMAQVGRWIGWKDWTADANTYYEFESTDGPSCLFDHSVIDGLQMPAQPFEPPSIYDHLEKWINGCSSSPFLTLARISGATEMGNSDDPIWRQTVELTPRTIALLSFMYQARDHIGTQRTVETLSKSGINGRILNTLPDGVAAAFYQAMASKRNQMSGRTNSECHVLRSVPEKPASHDHKSYFAPTHEALRDYHSICSSALEAEALQRWDASSEADRHAITKLIFDEDRRFPEASKLVNQTRPPVVECTPESDWTEVDLLEAQKELAQHVTRRTLSVAAGRGMMHFNARVPLLTERVPIPAFSLQCIMKSRNANESTQAMTFSADKSSFTEEKVCWAFFHNGAATGLMISNDAKGIDTSWILYNKPPELTNRHAGFLLALGLNGHLKTLAKWVAFKYLTPKHTMTSVGLLLGLSASFLGTMDTLITRLLSVHVTRLLPPGAAELNLSPLIQTTGIMGIGLLYHNSQHRRMSEVMLSEIENNDPEEGVSSDAVLRDEGYRLAAGFSLGLINLGQGKRLHGLHHMGVVERLLTIAVGTKNVNMVHVLDRATAGAVMAMAFIFLKTNDEAIALKVDVPDTLHQFDYVRPDIFLLRTLARHLIMWDSIQPTREFVKASLPAPYRWKVDLESTKFLNSEDMPFFNILAGTCFAIGLRFAGSQRHDVRGLLVRYLDQFLRLSRLPARNYDARVTLNSIRNCLDALALASASVMAGSGDLYVMRRLRALHGRTDKDTPFGSHLAAHMALGALFLAGGTRTFGTSNLAVASLCIAFYPVFPNDILDNRGHLQALRHLWALAVEGRCLVARDGDAGGSAVGGTTGFIHLQDGTTRSIRLPGLIPEFDAIKSIEVKGEGFWDSFVDFANHKSAEYKALRQDIKAENAVNIYLRRRPAYDRPPQDLLTAELQARSGAEGIPSVDPNAGASYAYAYASGSGGSGPSTLSKSVNPFEWLFELDSMKGFDHAERALVLGPTPMGDWNRRDLLQTTVVDSRLEFEKGILPPGDIDPEDPVHASSVSTSSHSENNKTSTSSSSMSKDKLWQLRLLFAWFDRWEREDEEIQQQLPDDGSGQSESLPPDANRDVDGDESKWFNSSGGTWLRKEVIERLRWRVWNMATGGDADNEEVERRR
ncbi:uncharacterized protein Z518_09998 [Rhinocladiella mackenziei CBS 650.93]|uniref:Anaphase-promoting complex subunit 1 N-terminal domain-containing protein n=1 Tax=Rhinocladiella mackenziei CBS 650.93 TaxID=1442369 RepID=A0A0D2GRK2_9EURO|nr:uncharacterized protein Z518_09998 [Rhinocladiella mackenziei CBS 650.93]KIX00933.1 hypothetical protein Z518_09998 [Rhinocladiella mackenziei CBS 650.93]